LIYLQGLTFRVEKFFKNLAGIKDVEDALQRLDKLTREEALVVAAEGLTVTRQISDKVEDIDDKIGSVNEGERYLLLCAAPEFFLTILNRLGVKENQAVIKQVVNQVNDLKRS
jgi:hypothetical protein